ncbi:hypothetical protein MRX96_038126 [Rhipicephalus microplus]
MPRSYPVGMTYAEASHFPSRSEPRPVLCATSSACTSREGGKALVIRLLSLPNTGMGSSALEYAGLISGAPVAELLPIPSHWDSRLAISTRAPGCRTGYPGHPVENGRKILLFLVPKEEERRKDWEYNLKRKEKPLAETIVVCEKHFAEHLVIRDYVYVIGGNEVRISRGRPALAAGAVPTLLPDLPAYLSKVLLKPRLERKRRGVFSSESAKKVRLSRRDEQEASLPEDQNVDPNARAFENDEVNSFVPTNLHLYQLICN